MCVLSHVQCFTIPWTVAHQALLSTWVDRKESFLISLKKARKKKKRKPGNLFNLSHVQLCDPMDCRVHGILQARKVVSLSLLQGIFPNQGSKSGLLHCRWIVNQLSHKGNLQSKVTQKIE